MKVAKVSKGLRLAASQEVKKKQEVKEWIGEDQEFDKLLDELLKKFEELKASA